MFFPKDAFCKPVFRIGRFTSVISLFTAEICITDHLSAFFALIPSEVFISEQALSVSEHRSSGPVLNYHHKIKKINAIRKWHIFSTGTVH